MRPLCRPRQSAEAIAGLLLGSLATAFPALCARYGEAEVRAIVARGPAGTEPGAGNHRTRQSAHRRSTGAGDRADWIRTWRRTCSTTSCDAMPPGDVHIAWHNGSAVRDAAALWEQVAAVLVPAGLLRADAMIKETVDGY